jgi:hypothetical protein
MFASSWRQPPQVRAVFGDPNFLHNHDCFAARAIKEARSKKRGPATQEQSAKRARIEKLAPNLVYEAFLFLCHHSMLINPAI